MRAILVGSIMGFMGALTLGACAATGSGGHGGTSPGDEAFGSWAESGDPGSTDAPSAGSTDEASNAAVGSKADDASVRHARAATDPTLGQAIGTTSGTCGASGPGAGPVGGACTSTGTGAGHGVPQPLDPAPAATSDDSSGRP